MYHNAILQHAARRDAIAAVLGAILLAASPAWASQPPRDDSDAVVGMTGTATLAARSAMAQWQPVAAERLAQMRGGFETGGLQVSFGIERAVYINGNLVVSTSLVIPDVSRITSEQAGRLAAALQTAANAGSVAAAAVAGRTGTAGSEAAASPGTAGSVAAGSAQGAVPAPAVIATATGTVTSNGLLNLIQNGPGNSFNAGTLAATPATVIQNTLNNQSIHSLLTIDAGVNTLQAFRAGIAGSVLSDALQRAASMR